jgi:predicted RNase H-like HicB family nuclease
MRKGKRYIEDYPILVFTKDYDGEKHFVADFPDLKGCGSSGKTVEEAIARARELAAAYFTDAEERGEAPPPASEEIEGNGRFVVRMPKNLYRECSRLAKIEGVSMNVWIRKAIEEKTGDGVDFKALAGKIDAIHAAISKPHRKAS